MGFEACWCTSFDPQQVYSARICFQDEPHFKTSWAFGGKAHSPSLTG